MKKLARSLAILLTLAFCLPANAAIQQVRVLGVGVNNSSAAAETEAVEYAKKRAVYLVALKMQVDNASARVAALKPDDFAHIVRGSTVLHVRREDKMTYADVSVSVIDTEIRRIFNLPEPSTVTDGPSSMRSVLVLPVYATAEATYLWEPDNKLREPLAAEVLRQSHGAVLVPSGDFEDLRLVDHVNVGTVTGTELKPMFDRYGADEIIVVMATLGADGTLEPAHVTLRRLTPAAARAEVMTITPTSAADKADARLASVAASVAGAVTQIAASTSQQEQEALAKTNSVKVHFSYANPRELATMQEAVRGAPGVILLEIPAISLQDVGGTVYFTGDKKALLGALSKLGVIVTAHGDDWVFSMR